MKQGKMAAIPTLGLKAVLHDEMEACKSLKNMINNYSIKLSELLDIKFGRF